MPSLTLILTGALGLSTVAALADATSGIPPVAAIGGGIVLLASVVAALGALGKRVWRALRGVAHVYRRSNEAFVTIVGNDEHPGVAASFAEQRAFNEQLLSAVADAATEARTAATEATRIGRITERLDERLTDLDDKVDAQSERITDHRRRQDATIAALREYLSGERDDLLLAKQGLEASVSELLMVQENERRDNKD